MIRIKKNGFFVERWNNDLKENEPIRIFEPTIDELHGDICEVEDDVTLRDIFELMNENIDFWEQHIGGYCSVFVNEGLQECDDPFVDVKSVEVSWSAESIDDNLDAFNVMDFHMVSDSNETLSMSFAPVNKFSHVPVVVDKRFRIYKDFEIAFDAGNLTPSLFQIIYSIFWELSFYGPPENREKEHASLLKTIDGIKNGTEKLYEFDLNTDDFIELPEDCSGWFNDDDEQNEGG